MQQNNYWLFAYDLECLESSLYYGFLTQTAQYASETHFWRKSKQLTGQSAIKLLQKDCVEKQFYDFLQDTLVCAGTFFETELRNPQNEVQPLSLLSHLRNALTFIAIEKEYLLNALQDSEEIKVVQHLHLRLLASLLRVFQLFHETLYYLGEASVKENSILPHLKPFEFRFVQLCALISEFLQGTLKLVEAHIHVYADECTLLLIFLLFVNLAIEHDSILTIEERISAKFGAHTRQKILQRTLRGARQSLSQIHAQQSELLVNSAELQLIEKQMWQLSEKQQLLNKQQDSEREILNLLQQLADKHNQQMLSAQQKELQLDTSMDGNKEIKSQQKMISYAPNNIDLQELEYENQEDEDFDDSADQQQVDQYQQNFEQVINVSSDSYQQQHQVKQQQQKEDSMPDKPILEKISHSNKFIFESCRISKQKLAKLLNQLTVETASPHLQGEDFAVNVSNL